MNTALHSLHRCGALLAINLLFLMVWGFTGILQLAECAFRSRQSVTEPS